MKTLALFVMMVVAAAQATAHEGCASVYGRENGQTRRADGKPYNPQAVGCAHRTLPLGSVHRVTNLENGRSVMCPIDDRGPYVYSCPRHGDQRILDLSPAAARAIGAGDMTRVRIE